jgi:hypothetical protein
MGRNSNLKFATVWHPEWVDLQLRNDIPTICAGIRCFLHTVGHHACFATENSPGMATRTPSLLASKAPFSPRISSTTARMPTQIFPTSPSSSPHHRRQSHLGSIARRTLHSGPQNPSGVMLSQVHASDVWPDVPLARVRLERPTTTTYVWSLDALAT